MITITRTPAPELAPYPKNGNFDTQSPFYVWVVRKDGRWMATESTLRVARKLANDYPGQTIKIIK